MSLPIRRHKNVRVPACRVVALWAALGWTGCAQTVTDPVTDMVVCDGPSCAGRGCVTDTDCKAPLAHCDAKLHLCVACLADTDCPVSKVCSGATHTCVAGCSAQKGCANDAGVCDADAGVCVECLSDANCPVDRPRCDPAQRLCFPCLPDGGDGGFADNCGPASYCQQANSRYSCEPGCKSDTDCSRGPDGGAGGDGGGGGLDRCDPATHQCVRCLIDAECAIGKVCSAGQCVPGCTDKHGCPNPLACCTGACVDLSSDFNNCAVCGVACAGGWNCCNAVCANPTNSVANCGGCGIACTVLNGVPGCATRKCTIDHCNAGYADCNGLYLDGCETNTNNNAANCGGCNNLCAIDHANARCTGGACAVDTCVFPYADCNGLVADGCELNVHDKDVDNCGACATPCRLANATPVCRAGACQIGTCDRGFADCNNDPRDGCEVDITTAIAHCGGCNQGCAPAHAAPACVAGACTVASCNLGYADCNVDPRDGCEINTVIDTGNCGGCGKACSSNNGVPSCVKSACQIQCAAGFADCNANVVDGCEINVNSDVANCGGCAKACAPANASATCTQGACRVLRCNAGYADCNNDPSDGCEANIAIDAANCGGCGVRCSQANGTPACNGGTCSIACDPGTADCNHDPKDGCETSVATSVTSCGMCGAVCALPHATPACNLGVCAVKTCDPGYADCDGMVANGCETFIQGDVANCGGCQLACSTNNGTPSCTNFACGIACAAGFADCNHDVRDGCEVHLTTDVANCGACGGACVTAHASPTCTMGACQIAACDPGYADCNQRPADGCEINTTSDTLHCGGCGAACSTTNDSPSCVMSTCRITCTAGFADCDNNVATGCEVSLNNDAANCGGCGTACSANHVPRPGCGGGVCNGACAINTADCNGNKQVDGCEVTLTTDTSNCGACGTICSGNNIAAPQCTLGTCSGACNAGFADCNANKQSDGCETDVAGGARNCGGCGVACSNNNIAVPACTAGSCSGACNAGFADCNNDKLADGCEVNTRLDPLDCGACGRACSGNHIAAATCAAGICSGACDTGWADCNNDKLTDGCETNVGSGVGNCGGCGVVCTTNNISNPTCNAGRCDGACDVGYADCNGNKQSDGCETSLRTDAANCGACGTLCSNSHLANPTCAAGVCGGACDAGYGDCNNDKLRDGCETNLLVTASACGACGAACSTNNIASPTCAGGACTGACNAGFADCNANKLTDGCEVNTQTSPAACGGCGNACSSSHVAVPACALGTCSGTCDAGYEDCNANKLSDGCETHVASDTANCGGCGTACSSTNIATPACSGGACTGACNAGFSDCNADKQSDGCETSTTTNVNACGGCGNVCSSNHVTAPSCTAGRCNGACAAGYADCNMNKLSDGCEVSTDTSPRDCGGCGVACSANNIAAPACTGGACTGACNMGYADCNLNKLSDGCETNLALDPSSCGACMAVCSGNNIANPTCGGGICNGACNAGFADCDNNKLTNGCEVALNTDASHCGGCGKACSASHIAAPTCAAGVCNGACDAGYADCNNNKLTDGCEVHTAGDVRNCGGCGVACSSANIATPTCTGGGCDGACNAGFADCDSDKQSNGCETNTQTTAAACGGCGLVCSGNNIANPTCQAGACTGSCNGGFADCNRNKLSDGCEVDVMNDARNCGGCGVVCSGNNIAQPLCAAGQCVGACNAGFADCNNNKQSDGCETSTTNTAASCGGCGMACSANNIATPTCSGSRCTGACDAGFADCNNNKQSDGCEVSITSDAANCGGCGTTCSTSHVIAQCGGGACNGACDPGYSDCDANKQTNGCEVNTGGDVLNCGGCGAACSTNNVARTCSGGVCQGACDPGYTDCNNNKRADGCEVHTAADVLNCGGCATVCSSNNIARACANGVCNGGCDLGFSDCNGNKQSDGCEVNLTTDALNCGGCGVVCSGNHVASPACANGLCVGACDPGYADCNGNKQSDGCELAVGTDAANCGGCGSACSTNNVTRVCSAGSCEGGTCASGFADCNGNKRADGCEINTAGDVLNCGGCGTVCSTNNISRACAGSACNGACASGFADCNGNKQSDGCEVHTDTDAANCGSCGGACSTSNMTRACSGGSCEGGVCATGYADCNSNKRVDGCEINTAGDASNCGACGALCSNNNIAAPSCSGGACNGACNGGYADCNGSKLVDGCEVNLGGDVGNCGVCGAACSPNNVVRACGGGSCEGGTCVAGFSDCNGNKRADGCEANTAGDVLNCGGCGTVCSTRNVSRACSGGSCQAGVCGAGFADCNGNKQTDGCEIDVAGDPNNCSACGTVCSSLNMATRTCGGGACNGLCSAGFADCNTNKQADGCEQDIAGSATNCGGCSVVCSGNNMATVTCGGGVCNGACNAGFADCNGNKQGDGCEVNTAADVSNCGGCGTVCSTNNVSRACSGGSCAAGSCTLGFADCNGNKQTDGCEINVTGDADNCGACATVCSNNNMATRTCNASTCNGTCAAGFGDCNNNKQSDGCETTLATDAANCGACGSACSNNNMATTTCGAGSCNGTCAAGFADCNNSKRGDGCETSLSGNSNCGGCGIVCSAGSTCTNQVCVVSCGVKINELQTGVTGGASTEFIELYNNCPIGTAAIDLTSWKLDYRSAGNNGGGADIVLATLSGTLAAGSYYLVCGSTFVPPAGITCDANEAAGMAASGAVGVRNAAPTSALLDSVSYGTLTVANNFTEGPAAAPSPPTAAAPGRSIERIPDGHDTNTNSTDFVVSPGASTPRAANQ